MGRERLFRYLLPGFFVTFLALGFLAWNSGDVPRTYPVTGQVLLANGQALTGGWVEFESIHDRTSARGAVRPDGTFVLTTFRPGDGALDGDHRAVVTWLPPVETKDVVKQNGWKQPFPSRFGRYDTSYLTFTVEKKANYFSIRLDSR